MGEDADFYDGSAADPALVEKLRRLKTPPTDPVALARLVDKHCRLDARLNLYKLHRGYADLRKRTRRSLINLKKYAAKLLADRADETDLYPFTLTLDDLLVPNASDVERDSVKTRVLAAVQLLDGLSLRSDLEEFHRRPQLDGRVTAIVRAIAEYWTTIEGKPFKGRVDREARSATLAIKDGSEASLARAVIDALGAPCTDSELETHLEKVRNELEG